MTATGTFEATLTPQTNYEATIGRMSIDKRFHGDLEATSKGQMLGVADMSVTVVPDSGAGELTGQTGKMTTDIVGELHSFEFEYTLE